MRIEDIFTNPTMIYQCSRQTKKCILEESVTQTFTIQFREEEATDPSDAAIDFLYPLSLNRLPFRIQEFLLAKLGP